MANACVCCTGLPGLAEALADLFWARLQRKIKPFTSVVIETTGLADPQPVLQIFKEDSLLRERYRLAAVIATFSATSGSRTVTLHPEAMSQVTTADLVVVTKTDLVQPAELAGLAASVSALNPRAGLAMSGTARLTAGSMLSMLASYPSTDEEPPASVVGSLDGLALKHSHNHHHALTHHSARTAFLALPGALKRQTLAMQLGLWIGKYESQLLRLKGMVRMDDGSVVTIQWATGDAGADIAPFGRAGDLPLAAPMGLTVIAEAAFDFSAGQTLVRLLAL
jgi:G3E family GTPase